MTSPDGTLHPSPPAEINFTAIGRAGVTWNRRKERPSTSAEPSAQTSSWVEFSAPSSANSAQVCTSSACHRSQGGSPKKNGLSITSRCPSMVTPLIPRLICLSCTKIKDSHTAGKLFPCSSEIIVADLSPGRQNPVAYSPGFQRRETPKSRYSDYRTSGGRPPPLC